MKLRFVNPHNVEHLLPKWLLPPFFFARNLDELLCEQPALRPTRLPRPDDPRAVDYWIEVKPKGGQNWDFAVCRIANNARVENPDAVHRTEVMAMGMAVIDTPTYQLTFPLGNVFRGAPSLAGTHTVYCHSITGDGPHNYNGVTSRTWFERFAQHRSEASRGSKLLFHRAMRERGGVRYSRVWSCGLTYQQAMDEEESLTTDGTLYPHGLNMIPGGFAGLRYLSSIGYHASTLDQRDAAMVCIMERDRLSDGSPNPLCAARWASDQEYVNSVICGHSGRLDVDQVRNIRMLAASGYDADKISAVVGDLPARVKRVVDNRRYQRVH